MKCSALKGFFSIFCCAAHSLTTTLERIEMNQAEMLSRLTDLDTSMAAIGDEVTKVAGETTALLAEVATLKDAVANAGNTSPEVDAALAAVEARAGTLAASVQGVDDLVPDNSVAL